MEAKEKPSLIEQAATWLAALDSGSADLDAFETWRDSDPRNAAAFAQVAATWEKLGDARSVVLSERAPGMAHLDTTPNMSRRRVLQAASIAAVVALGGIGSRVWARSSAQTAVGERRTILCDDGTRMDLNTDTSVEWRIRSGQRYVWLERGEIALDVAPAPSGLMVAVGDMEALLTPGQYNARVLDGTLAILVLSGRSTAMKDTATASAGQRLSVTQGGAATRVAGQDDLDRAAGWRRGEIVFSGETLEAAVVEYNRYLTRKLVIGDAQLGSVRLGGRFTSNDPDDFLAALRASFDIVAERREASTVLLSIDRSNSNTKKSGARLAVFHPPLVP